MAVLNSDSRGESISLIMPVRSDGREGIVRWIEETGLWLRDHAQELAPDGELVRDGFRLTLRMQPDGFSTVEVDFKRIVLEPKN